MTPRRTARLLAVAFAGSGALHLLRPGVYQWLVPPELGPARPWVLGSGVVEITAAGLLAAPRTCRAGGLLSTVLLVAFVPAHLHTLRVVDRPQLMAAATLRLVLQLPLVRSALRVAREG